MFFQSNELIEFVYGSDHEWRTVETYRKLFTIVTISLVPAQLRSRESGTVFKGVGYLSTEIRIEKESNRSSSSSEMFFVFTGFYWYKHIYTFDEITFLSQQMRYICNGESEQYKWRSFDIDKFVMSLPYIGIIRRSLLNISMYIQCHQMHYTKGESQTA